MTTSDRFDQYAEDYPTFSQPLEPYRWIEPTRSRPSRLRVDGHGGFRWRYRCRRRRW